ncbi:7328_t:CDS:2 [Paraglomus brasilianum]|uniref:7328_t:CDS:1 n=1 Tax=Paraglomus brasilianum TaxID=144538 RepID=A0A9N9BZ68_9GLOM|nr:7328_t:CDS:2 [Paraglomus brasilianum]
MLCGYTFQPARTTRTTQSTLSPTSLPSNASESKATYSSDDNTDMALSANNVRILVRAVVGIASLVALGTKGRDTRNEIESGMAYEREERKGVAWYEERKGVVRGTKGRNGKGVAWYEERYESSNGMAWYEERKGVVQVRKGVVRGCQDHLHSADQAVEKTLIVRI